MSHSEDAFTTRMQNILLVANNLKEITTVSSPSAQSPLRADHPPVAVDSVDLPTPPPVLHMLLEAGADREIAATVSKMYQLRAEELRRNIQVSIVNTSRQMQKFPMAASASPPHLLFEKIVTTATDIYLQRVGQWKEEIARRVKQASKAPITTASKNARTFNYACIPLLEHFFEGNPFPSHADKMLLAQKSNMEYRQIHVWFQNRRNRTRKEGKRLRKKPPLEGVMKPLDELYECVNGYISGRGPEPKSCKVDLFEGTTEADIGQNSIWKDVLAPPPHAFPSTYPPACHYDPFPCKGSSLSLSKPEWRRVPDGEYTPSLPVSIDDLAERFSHLSVRDGARSYSKLRSHAATAAITVIPSRAPHPALVVRKYSEPTNIVQFLPLVRAPVTRSKAFQSPSPTSKPVTLVPFSDSANQCLLPRKRKVAPLTTRTAPMALLSDDFWSNVFRDDTGCGTTYHADHLAYRSAHITSCFLELEKVNDDLESKLRNDFNDILNSMDRLSLSPTPRPSSLPPNPTRTIHNSSFTIAAVSWLLENIANPYPSSTIKASLAQQHSCSLSAVNTWFVNARRRTGWTAVCRDYFNNRRTDTLDAAYRALVDENPNRPLPPRVNHAFICVKAAAENLYLSTLTKNTLSSDLDAVARDTTDQNAVAEGEERHCETKGMAKSRYNPPSDGSCLSSPVPPLDESLTDDSDEEEEVLPPILAGRKRRSSFLESIPAASNKKRRKRLCSPSLSAKTAQLSSDEPLGTQSHENSCSGLTSPNSTLAAASRERRLSEADVGGAQKHPRAFTAGPRSRSASDPEPPSSLESNHIIDEWFHSNFDTLFALPPPANITTPDVTAQWEVELFSNYNISSGEQQRRPFNPPTGDRASVNSHTLDDFFRSLEDTCFMQPSETIDPAITISHVHSSPEDASESIDWISLLNFQTCEPSLGSVFEQSHPTLLPLPEIQLR